MTKGEIIEWVHTHCRLCGVKHYVVTSEGLEVLTRGKKVVHKLKARMKKSELDRLAQDIALYGSVSRKWDGVSKI